MFLCVACGVAHQALEEIEPAGDNILVQGAYLVSGSHCHYPCLGLAQVVVQWVYLELGWPEQWELPQCEFELLN